MDLRVPTDALGFLLFVGTAGYLTIRQKPAELRLRRPRLRRRLERGRRLCPGSARGRPAAPPSRACRSPGYAVAPALWFLVPCALFAGLSGLTGLTGLTVTGLPIIGFSAAPVFPLLTPRTAERVGGAHADRAIGLQIAGAGLGGALRPAGIGVLLTRHGVNVLGPALTAVSGLYLVLHRPQPDRSTQVAA